MTEFLPRTGDVEAALDAAQPLAEVVQTDHETVWVATRGDTRVDRFDLVDLFGDAPRRAKGIHRVTSAAGFVTAAEQFMSDEFSPVIYADESSSQLTMVLNDHDGVARPGWRDHLIELVLTPTTEWSHWLNGQGLGTQERFARTVQEGMAEIVDPLPSVMMDIAQNFHMTSQSKAKQAKRLSDGRTQVVYEEDIDAVAGEDGSVVIPEVFTLKVRPFYGAPLFEVDARLEYRPPRGGELQIGYQLHRPADVERNAFGMVVEKVSGELSSVRMVEGQA